MEMPEGWKKLDSNIPEGGQYHRIEEALYLMEEMAEALKEITESLLPYAPHSDEGIAVTKAEDALKKFKEWK